LTTEPLIRLQQHRPLPLPLQQVSSTHGCHIWVYPLAIHYIADKPTSNFTLGILEEAFQVSKRHLADEILSIEKFDSWTISDNFCNVCWIRGNRRDKNESWGIFPLPFPLPLSIFFPYGLVHLQFGIGTHALRQD